MQSVPITTNVASSNIGLTGAVLLDRNTHEHNVYRNIHTTECDTKYICLFVCLMVFNATFNNISVISWRSVLLVEEPGIPGQNH
jgi:hypothetical protein